MSLVMMSTLMPRSMRRGVMDSMRAVLPLPTGPPTPILHVDIYPRKRFGRRRRGQFMNIRMVPFSWSEARMSISGTKAFMFSKPMVAAFVYMDSTSPPSVKRICCVS